MKNYYEILGIPPSASDAVVKSAYRKLAIKLHPDKNEGDAFYDDFFKNVNEAYSILGNKESRTKYDAVLFQKRKENSTGYTTATEKPTPNTQQTYTKRSYYSVWDSVNEAKKNRNIAIWINLIVLTILIIVLYVPKSWSTEYSEQNTVIVREGKVIAVNGLNIRKEPHQWSKKIALIPFDSVIEILEIHSSQETIDGITANWMKVKYLNNVGWVWGGFIDTDVNNINEKETCIDVVMEILTTSSAYLKETDGVREAVIKNGGTGLIIEIEGSPNPKHDHAEEFSNTYDFSLHENYPSHAPTIARFTFNPKNRQLYKIDPLEDELIPIEFNKNLLLKFNKACK